MDLCLLILGTSSSACSFRFEEAGLVASSCVCCTSLLTRPSLITSATSSLGIGRDGCSPVVNPLAQTPTQASSKLSSEEGSAPSFRPEHVRRASGSLGKLGG